MILGEESMAQTISIGKQDFLYLRENNYFYIDKTDFIRQWWESADDITLITAFTSLWKNSEYEYA